MIHRSVAAIPITLAVLALAACGGDANESSSTPADSADMVKATSAIPGTLGRTPERAQEGVDSANTAIQRQADEVEQLNQQASGRTSP